MLTYRQQQILKIIVEEYIKTATPVGSKNIVENNHLSYSSATIRNECALLEAAGFLEKSHVSSGRIPSTQGYRFYVDYLMDQKLQEKNDFVKLKTEVAAIFANRELAAQDIIEKTSLILSEMTNLVSFAITENMEEDYLTNIEIVPFFEKALVLFSTQKGNNESRIFRHEKIRIEDLTTALAIFQEHLIGTKLQELELKITVLKPLLLQKIKDSEQLIQDFLNVLISFIRPNVNIYGMKHVFDNPEFTDINKIRELINFIESKSPLDFCNNFKKEQAVQVLIGEELGTIGTELAIMATSFQTKNGKSGKIAVIGPKRLEYERIVEILNWISENFSTTKK